MTLLLFLGDDLRVPKVTMADADTTNTTTTASIVMSNENNVLKRARSRHYLTGIYIKIYTQINHYRSLRI